MVQLFPAGADPLNDTPVDEDTTDGSGDYLLTSPTPGDFFVYIPTAPADAPLSSTGNGGDDQTDGDDNGIQTASGDPIQSPTINLTAGDEPTDATTEGPTGDNTSGALQDNLADDAGDMTVDLSLIHI